MAEIPEHQKAQAARRLPGITPVGQADWITVTDDYAAQIAEKTKLIAVRKRDIYQMRPAAEVAAAELLEEVLTLLRRRSEFDVDGQVVRCPDGRQVRYHDLPPLLALGHILQEDLCLHVKQGEAHHLMGALLCFPASWTLAEKIGKPLLAIHRPVAEYDAVLAKRVQRLFDGVQVGQPLWRANYLTYADPALYQPIREADTRSTDQRADQFLRSERQTIFRLPMTRAVVFAIHTTVAPRTDGSAQSRPVRSQRPLGGGRPRG